MFLNYNNKVDTSKKRYYGPDTQGNFYVVVDSVYDEETNKTRVEFEIHDWE